MRQAILRALARSFAAERADGAALASRGAELLEREWEWLAPLAQRFATRFESDTRPRQRDALAFLRADFELKRVFDQQEANIRLAHWVGAPPRMHPAAAAISWRVPAIETAGALADWLMLSPAELDWFADYKHLNSQQNVERLRHYRYRVTPKRSGGMRLIEAPKARLKMIQQRILATILEPIPTNPAAHGFVKGRSIQTFVTPHIGRAVVLRLDLRDFFASIPRPRVAALFRTAGYPEIAAILLAALCTHVTPQEVLCALDRDVRLPFEPPHLPQGAPTSPALANLCFYRADCRLSALAAAGAAVYTRYADDLAFSGDGTFARSAERFAARASAILLEEGFRVQHRKTRLMRQGVRQHLAGLVVNQRANLMRTDYDQLKATLTNCLRHGPESQNRSRHPHFRAHLEGRVAFVAQIHPEHGRRLRTLFESISW